MSLKILSAIDSPTGATISVKKPSRRAGLLEPEADDRFVLKGNVADRWGGRTNFQQDQAVERLRRAMSRAGVFRRLKQLGAPEGKTTVVVGGHELTW